MVSLKVSGTKPSAQAVKEMKQMVTGIKKYGNQYTTNRYFVYDGSTMKAGQSSKAGAKKYFKKGNTLFSIN
jgi:hypothetical protein